MRSPAILFGAMRREEALDLCFALFSYTLLILLFFFLSLMFLLRMIYVGLGGIPRHARR